MRPVSVSREGGHACSGLYTFLLRSIIQNVMGPDVKLIDSGAECVRDISVLLNYFEINEAEKNRLLQYRFYTTASAKSLLIAEHRLDRR